VIGGWIWSGWILGQLFERENFLFEFLPKTLNIKFRGFRNKNSPKKSEIENDRLTGKGKRLGSGGSTPMGGKIVTSNNPNHKFQTLTETTLGQY
jgi:hypothetical protein